MEIAFKAQKTMLVDWAGDTEHPEWRKLNEAIDARIKYTRSREHFTSLPNLQRSIDRLDQIARNVDERQRIRREKKAQSVIAHMTPSHRVTARDPGNGTITVHVQTDVGEVWLTVDRADSDYLDRSKRVADVHNGWPIEWVVRAERGPAPFVTLVLTRNDAEMLTFPKPRA